MAELEDLALAHRHADGTAFTLPRLLQETARQQQAHLKPPPALTTALEWVNETFPYDSDEVHFWPIAEPLAPHAQSIALHAADRALSSPTALLLNQVALFYEAKGQHTNAEPLIRRALAMDEASLGLNHPHVAIRLSNLASLLQDTDRLAEAEPLMRRALAICESSFGPEHSNVAIRLNNLAQLLQATQRMDEAESLMRRALAMDEASFGPEHPDVAIRLNNLAQLLQDTDRLSEAEPLMRRAAVILITFTKETKHPHSSLNTFMNNYGSLLIEMGDTPEQVVEKVSRLW